LITPANLSGAVNQFAAKTATFLETLMSSVKARGLTVEHQQMLARKCDFSLNWLEWNDPEADRNAKREARRDTCEAFKARYLLAGGPEPKLGEAKDQKAPQRDEAVRWRGRHREAGFGRDQVVSLGRLT
jgi:hypothetical protein